MALAFFPGGAAAQQGPVPAGSVSGGDFITAKPDPLFHEDLTTPEMRDSRFEQDRPVLAEKDDVANTNFIRERYQVAWRPQDPFDLYVVRPRGAVKPPVILYLYSFPDDTEQFKTDTWCDTAVRGGFAAVGFVGAVTGHRTRFRLPKEWFVSEMPEALASTAHDIQLILDYLTTRGDLDMSRVGMFGMGSGAAEVILASAVDPRLRAIDLVGPWADWPGWLAHAPMVEEKDRARYLTPEFLSKLSPLEPVAWLPKVKAKSVRIQDIRKNKAMSDELQVKLEAAAPDFAYINQYGNGRAFLGAQPPVTLFDWLKDALRQDTKTRAVASKTERIRFYPEVQPPPDNWPNVGTMHFDKPQNTAAGSTAPPKEKENPK